MKRQTELILIITLLILAVVLRTWDLAHLPPGFSDDELAHIHVVESVRDGDVAVYYQGGDGRAHAALFGVFNALVTDLVGEGLLAYRLLSLWGGLLTLALLYALARRLFGVPVGLVALGVMSVNLRSVFLARSVTSEALVPLHVILTLLLLVEAFNLRRAITFRVPATMPFTILALLLGGTGYLHYTALVLGPLAVIFFIHLLITRQPLARRVWSVWVYVIVLATIIATPYLVSTLRDPQASELHAAWRERPHDLTGVIDGVLSAVGGVIWQGDERVTANVPGVALLGPVLSLALIVGVAEAIRRWRDPRYALLLIVLAAGLLTDAWVGPEVTYAANLVALPAVVILVGVGAVAAWQTLRVRGTPHAWQPVALALVVVLGVNVLVLRSRLQDWKHRADVQDAYHTGYANLAAYFDRTPDGLPVSVCMARLAEPGPSGLSPQQVLDKMMHRDDVPIRHSDCRAGLVLINAGAPMRFAFADIRDRDTMPPELLDWLKDGEPVPVEGLPDGAVLHLDVEQRLADAGGQWAAMSPVYFMPGDDGNIVRATLPVPFEDGLTFAGYDPALFASDHVSGGDPLVLVTYWRVDKPLPPNLGIFAHLLAYTQTEPRVLLLEPWAEANTIDVRPRELEPRDFFIQVSYIWLRDNLKPGAYALTVGAFVDEVAVLENHLPVLDAAVEYGPHGDRLLLGDVTIVAPVEEGAES